MIEFGYILIIIFELIIAFVVIFGLIKLEKSVKSHLYAVNTEAHKTLCTIKNTHLNLKMFNKHFSSLKRINIKNLKQAILLTLDIINFILLIRSMDFKNLKKAKNFKKLIPFGLIKKLIFNFKK